ncbi:alcohol dehydrogenase catalytic domain-containing protein [Amorphus sp. 3PC139-8]|uniref:alcohol dehydrogenase catalytic domain-containing protein n=1 Tax=Amorphus sp. 3PC139-8 TaxID=2735676 RepID=UPI00345DBD2F
MKALTFHEFGGPEVFQVIEIPTPEPGPEDVLLRVHAAGICYHDVLSRAGKLPRDRTGVVLGHEISGEIAACGENVDPSRLGERVVVYHRRFCGECRHCLAGRHDLCRNSVIIGEDGGGGGYAEFCCVPATNALRIPDELDLLPAALAACPVGTSVRATLGVADTRPGDVVLVTGASGGLGLHQIKVAKAVGAHVIAVSTSEAKVDAISAAGADEIVVSPKLDFSREVWSRTAKQGVDVVLENVGTATLPESMRACAQNAAIVVLGNIGAAPVSINPGLVIGRRLRIMGSGNCTFADLRQALRMMASKQIVPVIDTVLPFAEVGRAHAMIEGRGVTGRVVLSGW